MKHRLVKRVYPGYDYYARRGNFRRRKKRLYRRRKTGCADKSRRVRRIRDIFEEIR